MATNPAPAWDNYRSNKRVVLEVPVSIVVTDSLRSYLFGVPRVMGRSSDASMTGLLVVTEGPLPQKAGVSVRVDLGDSAGEVTLRGDVMWSRTDEAGKGFLSGIRLREKPRAAMNRWLAFVGERIRRSGG